MSDLRKITGVKEKLRLEHFLRFSEIFESVGEPKNGEKVWEGVKEALSKALTELKTMRNQEGTVLVQDLITRVKNIEGNIMLIVKPPVSV